MRQLTMNSIMQEAKEVNDENNLKTAKLQFTQFLEKHPNQRENIILFLTELLDSTFVESDLPNHLVVPSPQIEETKMYDLNSYCKFLGIKAKTTDYNNLRQKLTFARENNLIKGEQQNLGNGKFGKKYFYSLSDLKQFTLLREPNRFNIFNESIKNLQSS